MRTTTARIAAAIFALCAMTVTGFGDEIPQDIQGKWAPTGACDGDDAITLTATTIAFGSDEPQEAEYFEDDSPAGNGAVHLAEEGDVSNWEYDEEQNVLLFNQQGYGMGVAPVSYQRCE